MQYTIRGIPPAVDDALRERARAAGKSLNEAAIDALTEGAGVVPAPRKRRNLDDLAGTIEAEDPHAGCVFSRDRNGGEIGRASCRERVFRTV